MLRTRVLAFVVPVLALVISDIFLASEMTSVRAVIYAMFLLPAFVAFMPDRVRAPGMFVPAIIAYSLLFFVVTNLAVWAFSGMYPLTAAGLATCYAAALPFLPQTVIGDLFWAAVLFGGAALRPARTPARPPLSLIRQIALQSSRVPARSAPARAMAARPARRAAGRPSSPCLC